MILSQIPISLGSEKFKRPIPEIIYFNLGPSIEIVSSIGSWQCIGENPIGSRCIKITGSLGIIIGIEFRQVIISDLVSSFTGSPIGRIPNPDRNIDLCMG
jgi:hypothetical protein